jgi:hypothetical protein
MAALALERRGNGWRLQLNGDWSLAAMASIDQELRTLTTPIDHRVVFSQRQLDVLRDRQGTDQGAVDASSRQIASDNRLTAIVDAYEHAADVALAEIVANTSRTLQDSLEHP